MRRIGLTQRVQVLEERGERRDALDQAWIGRCAEAGLLGVPIPNRLEDVSGWLGELRISGLILTGGEDPGAAPERDRLERELLALAASRRLPVLGVCRGLQLMVAEGGGRLVPVEGHVARPHRIRVVAEAGLPLSDGRTVNSFHGLGVREPDLGPDWRPAAFAPDDTVEAVAHRALPFAGVMWHPEREPLDAEDVRLLRWRFERA